MIDTKLTSTDEYRLLETTQSGLSYYLYERTNLFLPKKISYIGNSLLMGSGYGMCASAEDKDYYSLINKYIETITRIAPITTGRNSAKGYEGATTLEQAKNTIANATSMLSGDEDCVIIQLGDNVNSVAKKEIFKTSCKLLTGQSPMFIY